MVEINILENGPILVKGETIVTKGEEKIEVKENYALCRCGQTKIQPMCDGAHKTCNFTG
jgi:CDGSH-type Zn-finger protein